MHNGSYRIFKDKVIIRIKDRLCDTPTEMLSSKLFLQILTQCIRALARRNSQLLGIFDDPTNIDVDDLRLLIETLSFLTKLPAEHVVRVVDGSDQFFRSPSLFNAFVEYLYNYWREMQRLIVCDDSHDDRLDQRPYRTFNRTIESLTHLVRSTYRDVQENITGNHPRIYRQVRAGAEIATIAMPKTIDFPQPVYQKLNDISVIRQVLIYPPLIFNPPMNKRTGSFERVDQNPLDFIDLNKDEWLCYPAKVGSLLIMVYFSMTFFELGFALCNLFELADDEDLKRQPDAVYLFGVPEKDFPNIGKSQTIFYDDNSPNGILAAVAPDNPKYGYFGYLKKMILTLHNIKMMKMGRLPYHGAMVNLAIRDKGNFCVLIVGDTGAGKSETLEALRSVAGEEVQEITIIADDMGSLEERPDGSIVGYGTETGAFVRLDDLQPGFAFGQIDRTIIMSPAQVNARVVLPVTTYENVIKGYTPDLILYANNYDPIDEQHPILERFETPEQAIEVFKAGAVMSKGTTSTTGLVKTYYANIFGPEQYPDLHEPLAQAFFKKFFERNIFVGQMRTRLGLSGEERSGPEASARALLEALRNS